MSWTMPRPAAASLPVACRSLHLRLRCEPHLRLLALATRLAAASATLPATWLPGCGCWDLTYRDAGRQRWQQAPVRITPDSYHMQRRLQPYRTDHSYVL